MEIKIDISCDASTIIKMELTRNHMTHEKLAEKMSEISGLDATKASIANKLSRGSFSADFFIKALMAMANRS